MPTEHPSTPDPTRRLDLVEESIGYTERTVEQLSAEITDLNKRVQSLTKRLAVLEAGLTKLQQPGEDPDPE